MKVHVGEFTVEVQCLTKLRHHKTGRTSKDTEVYVTVHYPASLTSSNPLLNSIGQQKQAIRSDTFRGTAKQDPGVKGKRKGDTYNQVYAKRLAMRRLFAEWNHIMSTRFAEYVTALGDDIRDIYHDEDELKNDADRLLHQTFPRDVRRVAWHLLEMYMGKRRKEMVGRWFTTDKASGKLTSHNSNVRWPEYCRATSIDGESAIGGEVVPDGVRGDRAKSAILGIETHVDPRKIQPPALLEGTSVEIERRLTSADDNPVAEDMSK